MARAFILTLAALAGLSAPAHAANLMSLFLGDTEVGEMRATIWVDPDGCEHWVMDDGLEGYMSQHLDREGKPVCRGATGMGICKTFDMAAMFTPGSAALTPKAKMLMGDYFKTIPGQTIFVNGHTDSIGSEQANLQLSLKRAMIVADYAREFGVNAEPRGFGEQIPIADNATPEGRAKNRRVELTCN